MVRNCNKRICNSPRVQCCSWKLEQNCQTIHLWWSHEVVGSTHYTNSGVHASSETYRKKVKFAHYSTNVQNCNSRFWFWFCRRIMAPEIKITRNYFFKKFLKVFPNKAVQTKMYKKWWCPNSECNKNFFRCRKFRNTHCTKKTSFADDYIWSTFVDQSKGISM